MTHHLELAQGSRRSSGVSLPLGPVNNFINGCERLRETLFIDWLGAEGCSELNGSQFVRLSQELEDLSPNLRGTQVQRLKDLCLHANCSEEFFLSVSKDQWLRTVITSDEHPETLLFSNEKRCSSPLISSITVHSIVVPCYPYWSKLQAARDEAAPELVVASNTKRLYFPSTFLEDALSTGMSIVQKVNEWEEREEAQGAIADQWHELRDGGEQESSSWRPFWEIRPDDVEMKNRSYGGGGQATVGKVSWRGGIFVRKDFNDKSTFDTELEAVLRVSHPHVVYSFGVCISTDKKQCSLLMELLDRDLLLLIEDRVRLKGRSEPPFSCLESVDMLLQIAKAMAHMHALPEPVIHGDLKPKNILVSQCEILGDVCQFLVKVADFGSARILKQNASRSVFNPDGGTTVYAAPEVLATKLYPERKVKIKDPKKIDIYSFGILAFQILTGLEPYKKFPSLLVPMDGVTELVPYEGVSSRQSLKEGVIAGHLRPPLRDACGRPNFWNDLDLMALVESCWHRDASARPAFSEVTSRLQSIYNHLNLDPTTEAHAFARSSQADAINGASCQRTVNGSHAFPPAQATTNADDNGRAQASNPPSYYEDKRRKGFRKRFVFANLLRCARISPGNVTD